MKQIFNIMANETQVEEVTTTKMDAKFVSDLQGIFRKIPKRTQMRLKQLPTGQLMIKLHAAFYGTNMEEKKEQKKQQLYHSTEISLSFFRWNGFFCSLHVVFSALLNAASVA